MHRAEAHLALWLALSGACTPTACPGRGEPGSIGAGEPTRCDDCNLVIISLTAARKDHLGLFGYGRPTTPNIERFFAHATLFDGAFAPTSWTLPVAASMFTSLYPYSHGLMDRYDGGRLPEGAQTLAEVLRGAGFRTAAITGGGDYNRRYGLDQGFADWVDEDNYDVFGIRPTADSGRRLELAYLGLEDLIPVANEWLEANRRERFFLFLQGYDAHCPFTPRPLFDTFDPGYAGSAEFSRCIFTLGRVEPLGEGETRRWPVYVSAPGFPRASLSERDLRHMVALYDGEIAQADHTLAALFDALGRNALTERTLVVLLAEHGDLFGEHGRFMRGGPLDGTFYDPVVNFPLAIRHPKLRQKKRVEALVETTDLLPTLLDLLGVADPAGAKRQGRSFSSLLEQAEEGVHDRVFGGAHYAACRTTLFSGLSVAEYVRERQWKLIHEEQWSIATRQKTAEVDLLFDLRADAGEERDLSGAHPDLVRRLRRQLASKFPQPAHQAAAAACSIGERGEGVPPR